MITQKEINDFIKKIDYEHYERDTVTKEERQIIRKALNNNDIILTGYNSKAVRNIVGVFNAEITLTICHQLPDPKPMTEDEPLYEVCFPVRLDLQPVSRIFPEERSFSAVPLVSFLPMLSKKAFSFQSAKWQSRLSQNQPFLRSTTSLPQWGHLPITLRQGRRTSASFTTS